MRRVALFGVALGVISISASAQERTIVQAKPAFQPRLVVGAEAPALYVSRPQTPAAKPIVTQHVRPGYGVAAPVGDETEIICGTTVIRKRADVDPKIMTKSDRSNGAAIRRITPPVCSNPK